MSEPRVLLLACYELGRPPLSLAWPLAFLHEAGLSALALDLAVEAFDPALARAASLVAISAPMHTALRLGLEAARRVRAANPAAHVCFFGHYAWLNAGYLLSGPADSVLGGEAESALVALARAVEQGADLGAVPGVRFAPRLGVPSAGVGPVLQRQAMPVPRRAGLPPLRHYARYVSGGRAGLAGYVEASRGCLHTCRHCPIVPVYHGRFFVVPADVVLADVRQQVALGAVHLTFGDPDFLNGPGHAFRLARALHAEFPHLTFDFTTKIEHMLQHARLFPEFAALGCTFVTSAVESLSDAVLARLNKGHTAADVTTALAVLDEAGIALHPTLLAFTPWTTLPDYLDLVDFVLGHGLEEHVAPVQLSVRLLLPPGSPLLQAPDATAWLGSLDPAALAYQWRHPDPRLDHLYEQVAARVEQASQAGEPAAVTHAALRQLAYQTAGREAPPAARAPARPRPAPPRLTENWFC